MLHVERAWREASFQDRWFFIPWIMAYAQFVRTMMPTVMFFNMMRCVSP